jgi:hypothetical protein
MKPPCCRRGCKFLTDEPPRRLRSLGQPKALTGVTLSFAGTRVAFTSATVVFTGLTTLMLINSARGTDGHRRSRRDTSLSRTAIPQRCRIGTESQPNAQGGLSRRIPLSLYRLRPGCPDFGAAVQCALLHSSRSATFRVLMLG